jgi:alpha-ketoglutarate-dependent taurine dioxygenase
MVATEAAPAGLQLEPLQPGLSFGAVVTGLDLSRPLSESTWTALEAAFLEHGLLCIRGQSALSTESLVDFANHWRTEPTADGGRKPWLDEYSATSGAELTGQKERTKATAQATAQFRIDRHGVPHPDGEIRVLGNRPGRYRNRLGKEWHSDGSGVTAMLGKIIPSRETRTTLFACGHEAFAALPPAEQQQAQAMTVVISTKYRTGQGDDADIEYGYRLSADGLRREVAVDESRLSPEILAFKAAAPQVRAPLVKYHGVTGKPAMHVNPMGLDHLEMAGSAMDDEESAEHLRQLLLPAVAPGRVYEHEWQAGDLLLFDNRRMLHSTPAYVPDGPTAEEQLIHHVSYQAAFADAFVNCACVACPTPSKHAFCSNGCFTTTRWLYMRRHG